MTSSSMYFFVLLSQFLLIFSASAITSTKYIDTICQSANNNPFCFKTLTAYPPAVSATNLFSLANIIINLGKSHASKTGEFVAKTAKKEPTLHSQFMSCQDEYEGIQLYLTNATTELKKSPSDSNYDVMLCFGLTTSVKDLVGGNRDNFSKTLMEMTLHMENLLDVANAATVALGA